ncbi:MAG TPA: DRTGG domain-containing protein [Anaerolineaceae bacterium]
MKIKDIIPLVNGKLISKSSELEREIKGCFGADLMSDVLASIQPEAVLCTGLCNPQVVRTAVMADVAAIILVRGKQPPKETIDLAVEEKIPFISTPYGMYEVCGRLFQAGLPSLEQPVDNGDCSCDE